MSATPVPTPLLEGRNTFAHQAALASLLSALLAVLVGVAITAATHGSDNSRTSAFIAGSSVLLLTVVGFILAIVALCGIPRHGRRRILGRSIVGLTLNGALMIFMVTALVAGVKRAAQNMKTTSQKLSGDDASVLQAMSDYLAGLQKGVKKYGVALTSFREAKVLGLTNLKEKTQIEPRREIVRGFLAANAELKQLVADSEQNIRAQLVELHVAPAQAEAVLRGFNTTAAPRNALTLQIGACDQRIGDAALGALDLIESNWGKWRYEPASNRITFVQASANDSYKRFLSDIDTASREQISLQDQLEKLQQQPASAAKIVFP